VSTEYIKLIVGLGNPGGRYEATRHNVGYWFVDRVAMRYRGVFKKEGRFQGLLCRVAIGAMECALLKPETFMNHSGRSVAAFCNYFRLDPRQMLVVHDDLDLEPGVVRFKTGGGHGGHNGLRDIIAATGSREFHRLRVGIGHPGDRNRVVDYVLSPPSKGEVTAIESALDRAEEILPLLLGGEFQKGMNRLHAP